MSVISDRLEQQADILFDNVRGWEESALRRIGERIKKTGRMTLADVKTLNNIASVKQDMKSITEELAKMTSYNISQIERIYGEVIDSQHLANRALYDYRDKQFVPFAENRELQALVRAAAKVTGAEMINLSKVGGLCMMDRYGNFKGIEKAYIDVLDRAVMQVSSGALDFHSAMRESIIELGGSGIRVKYDGGVTRRLDSAVRQSLLWGAKQASIEYNNMIGKELVCDGIEIDWHSNPRPEHEFMQGMQYVIGKARMVNGVFFESADEALARLEDYGCLHFKTPILCGISEPRHSPEELKRLNEQNNRTYVINGKTVTGYDATQMMRRLESAIREQKSIRSFAKSSGDAELERKSIRKIKIYRQKYDEICDITGLPPQKRRMGVTKYEKILENPCNFREIVV